MKRASLKELLGVLIFGVAMYRIGKATGEIECGKEEVNLIKLPFCYVRFAKRSENG